MIARRLRYTRELQHCLIYFRELERRPSYAPGSEGDGGGEYRGGGGGGVGGDGKEVRAKRKKKR